MSIQEQTRKLVDRFNKTYAKNPMLATGGDNRSTAEAINTGAIARMHGAQQQLPRGNETVPLGQLVKPQIQVATGPSVYNYATGQHQPPAPTMDTTAWWSRALGMGTPGKRDGALAVRRKAVIDSAVKAAE